MGFPAEGARGKSAPDNSQNAEALQRDIFASPSLNPLLIFGIVLVFSFLGILSRPLDFLAAFWPANAVLLGLFLRRPQLATALGWMAAFLGYMVADMAMAGEIGTAVWLTLSNLTGVATAVFIVGKFGADVLDMRKPLAVLYLFAVCAVASLAAAIVGAGAAPTLLHKGVLPGLGFWLTTELLNFTLILPLILTFPTARNLGQGRKKEHALFSLLLSGKKRHWPLYALVLSLLMGLIVGGPGAILFPVPALLWCALSYSLFITSLLTMLVCSFMLVAISTSWLAVPFSDDYFASTMSVRLGILLLALAPLTVASINAARIELLHSLYNAANYDGLTKALSRSAFMLRASRLVETLQQSNQPFSVIMVDIDHFKAVNDTCGHAVGDQVLVQVSATLRHALREGDLFGRLGGEEFAIVLAGLQEDKARLLANRLCKSIENAIFLDEAPQPLDITISIGIAVYDDKQPQDIGSLLSRADKALYRAKNAGRNQVAYA